MSVRKNIISVLSLGLVLAIIVATAQGAASTPQRSRQVTRQPSDPGWTVPPDTIISLRLDRTLSSKTSRVGDRFTATVMQPVYMSGRIVIPTGSVVEGRIIEVTPARRMSRSGTIALDFDDLILPDGSRHPLEGNLTSDDPETREMIDEESRVSGKSEGSPAVFVGGGGAIGAVLGGIAGGGKGAVLGGVVGAGAGVAGILLSKGEEAQVPAGAPFGIQLTQPLVIRENRAAYDDPRSNDEPVADPDPDTDREPEVDNHPEPVRSAPPARVESAPARVEPAPSSEPLPLSSSEMIRRAQHALRDNGYYEGEIDGTMSPRTSRSLKTYQRENKLPETGNLDQATAQSLGIMRAGVDRSIPAKEASTRGAEQRGEQVSEPVLATVLSASANRTSEGAVYVLINTQAPTGGWRWFGDSVVNGDTLEVYARAIRPSGMATQALTRGRIELNVRDGVQYVRRVVVHGAEGDINILLGGRSTTQPRSSSPSPSALNIQRQAEEILAEYQRLIGARLTGAGVEFEGGSQAGDPEIELLFALDNFANASRLYARLIGSLQGQNSLRGATLSLAKEARRADRVITTTSSRTAAQISRRWDAIRQDILKLMQTYNISSSELEN